MTDIRKVWIMTVPVLCTSHIPPDQIDQLEDPNSVAHDLGDDGYLIFCGENGDTNEDGSHPNDDENMPWLTAAMAWARKNGSNGWMRFAVGGTVVAELQQFEWLSIIAN